MTRIKFCGMTLPEDAALAAELGASHVGVIFAESPRRVTAEQAVDILSASAGPRRVGVFGQSPVTEVARIANEVALDVAQVHAAFSRDDMLHLREVFGGEIWAVLPVDISGGGLGEGTCLVADVVDALVFDTSVVGRVGGTGIPFDWAAAAPAVKAAARQIPVVLAGGLKPENVARAIAELAPAIVDVSSGVELSPGVKDRDLMRAFARAVASASTV